MSQKHLKHLRQHFNQGLQVQPPEQIQGGLLHIMWRLDTDKGFFAIKQLSEDIDLKNQQIIKNYELSEGIASRFVARGIPSVCAIA